MNVCFVILNYHDEKRVINLSKKIVSFSFKPIVFIVNNNEDKSNSLFDSLKEFKNIKLMEPVGNIGYPNGYNIAFRFILSQGNFDYIFSINSDVDFSEFVSLKCIDMLELNDKIGLISPRMITLGKEEPAYWSFPTYEDLLKLNFGFYKKSKTSDYKFQNDNSEYKIVDVIRASFFCIRNKALKDVGGYSNETFLYNNENILAKKLLDFGYKSAILTNCFYYHNHVNGDNNYKRLKIGYRDNKIYMKNYLHSNFFQIQFYSLSFWIMYFPISIKKFFFH